MKPLASSNATGQTSTQVESDSLEKTSDEIKPPPTKKRKRGQNKQRPRPARISFSEMLCPYFYLSNPDSKSCPFGERCRYLHDLDRFMASKPPDIDKTCYLFSTYGKCPYGRACRFGSCHLGPDRENIIDSNSYDSQRPVATVNILSKTLQEKLRKRNFEFLKSEAYLSKVGNSTNPKGANDLGNECEGCQTKNSIVTDSSQPLVIEKDITSLGEVVQHDSSTALTSTGDTCGTAVQSPSTESLGALTDEGMVRVRSSEKKKV